jgi:hypothetical protein
MPRLSSSQGNDIMLQTQTTPSTRWISSTNDSNLLTPSIDMPLHKESCSFFLKRLRAGARGGKLGKMSLRVFNAN